MIEHPLWRIFTATGDVLDELTRAAKGQRPRLVPPDAVRHCPLTLDAFDRRAAADDNAEPDWVESARPV